MTIQARSLTHLLTTAALLAACRPPTVTPELPLCPALEVVAPDGEQPPASVWFNLLLASSDGGPTRACSGEPIAAPTPGCGPASAAPIPLAQFDDHALVFGEAGDGHLLVWARTHRTAAGDALGPVALVRYAPTAISVHALGMLEAPATSPLLTLYTTSSEHEPRSFLVAEGERCPESRPEACAREARILALDGRRFVTSDYYDANAVCLEPSRVPLFHREPVPGAADRSIVDRRLISADEQGLFVQEELEFFAGDQLLRRAAETRRIDYRGGRLTVQAPSLWSRLAHVLESPA